MHISGKQICKNRAVPVACTEAVARSAQFIHATERAGTDEPAARG